MPVNLPTPGKLAIASAMRPTKSRVSQLFTAMISIRTLFPLFLAALLTACAQLPPAPHKAPKHEYIYKIGPGDELDIKVWRNSDLSVKVPVRPDGKITAPLIKDIIAVGKTPQSLGQEIEQRLGTYIRDPSVSVVVTRIVGDPFSVIRVIGQAQKPGSIPFQRGMTLLDVLTRANGLTRTASGNNAVLVRAVEKNKQYRIRLDDLLNRGDATANIEVAPGDAIMIPESLL